MKKLRHIKNLPKAKIVNNSENLKHYTASQNKNEQSITTVIINKILKNPVVELFGIWGLTKISPKGLCGRCNTVNALCRIDI